MTIQDNNEEIQLLQRLLKKAQEDLEKARAEEAYWASMLQDNLKSVEYLEFLLKLRGKQVEPQKTAAALVGRFEGKTIKGAAFEILRAASRPLHVDEICERFKAGGKEVSKDIVSTILSQQVKKGVFKKVGKGVFALPDGSEEKE